MMDMLSWKFRRMGAGDQELDHWNGVSRDNDRGLPRSAQTATVFTVPRPTKGSVAKRRRHRMQPPWLGERLVMAGGNARHCEATPGREIQMFLHSKPREVHLRDAVDAEEHATTPAPG
jgi:hypothetical protein